MIVKKVLHGWLVCGLVGIFLLGFGLSGARAWPWDNAAAKSLTPPFPLPQLELASAVEDGGTLSLHGFNGSVMLVNFWATWCQPCVEEMPTLNRLAQELAGQGLVVIGISMDSGGVKPVRKLTQKMGIAYPLVMGGEKAAKQFGEIIGIPVTFLVDRHGTVIKRYDGPRDYAVFKADIEAVLQ